MSSPHLIYFGQENLQRGIWSIDYDGTRSATPAEPQAIAQARANGASVVNTKLGPKNIQLTGWANVDQNTGITDLRQLLKEYDKIFETQDEEYLRYIPSYQILLDGSSVSGISASNDATGLNLNTDVFQLDTKSSIGFNVDVSATGTNVATISGALPTIDLSSLTDTGNFELWLYIPDVYYITSIDFRIGSSSSDYYSNNFTSCYDGRPLKYGWSYFSVPWNGISETGTVVDTAIDYFWIQLNYESSAEDITGCAIGGILWVDEDQLRNFPVYRQGEIQRSGNPHEISQTDSITMNFLNHTGYAIGTHSTSLVSEDGITDSATTQQLNFDGSIDPNPKIELTVNDKTNLASIKVTNLNSSQSVTISPTSVNDDDIAQFGGVKDGLKLKTTSEILTNGESSVMRFEGIIPDYKLGLNRLKLDLISTGIVSEENTATINGSNIFLDTNYRIAQSFVTGVAGDLTTIGVWLAMAGIDLYGTVKFRIKQDDSGSPATGLGATLYESYLSFPVTDTTAKLISDPNVTLTGLTLGTKYWIEVVPIVLPTYPTSIMICPLTADTGYADGTCKYSDDAGATWNATSKDTRFIASVQPKGWDVDLNVSYYKLFKA